MATKNLAIRKRAQVLVTNKTMFLWVAITSVLFGVAIVVSVFLVQMSIYNEKVLSEKQKTITTLTNNQNSISALEDNIRALDANQSLIDLKAQSDDRAIQVILDALPSDANSSALGASIQNKLLYGIKDLTLISLQVDPVAGVESSSASQSLVSSVSAVSPYVINFKFSVSGSETALKEALKRLEASIRTIDVVSLKIEGQNNNNTMTVRARAFYEPAQTVDLKDKVVK
jgi:hypothetical protein